MSYFLGIDIGSSSSKGVLIDDEGNMFTEKILTGVDYVKAAGQILETLVKKINAEIKIDYTVATGHGAALVPYSDKIIADMRCCAKGVSTLYPAARTLIDIEGQSTYVMGVNENGLINNFVMNEKCAAGSGRFIDIISNVLQIPIEEIGPLSLVSQNPVKFTTACAVFGETEAISRVAEGVPKEDIVAGVHSSLADKIISLVNRVGLEEDCVVCGGGALNIGLVKWLEKKLKIQLIVPPSPRLITAFGAAVLARDIYTGKNPGK